MTTWKAVDCTCLGSLSTVTIIIVVNPLEDLLHSVTELRQLSLSWSQTVYDTMTEFLLISSLMSCFVHVYSMVKIRQKHLDTGANRFIETPTWKMLTRQSGNVAKQKIIIKKKQRNYQKHSSEMNKVITNHWLRK